MVSERAAQTPAICWAVGGAGGCSAVCRRCGGARRADAADRAPTKALCKGKTFKIGYDVFSGTQPFANLVTKGLKDAAKKTGCVTVITTVDNLNGPVAVGERQDDAEPGSTAIIDFNVLAAVPAGDRQAREEGQASRPTRSSAPSCRATRRSAPTTTAHRSSTARSWRTPAKKKYGSDRPVPGRRRRAVGRPDHHAALQRRRRRREEGLPDAAERSHHPGESRRDRGRHVQQRRSPRSPASHRTAVVLTTAVNDEVDPRHVQGGAGRKLELPRQLVRRRPVRAVAGLRRREHYVGALYLEPEKWGESALATIMRMANKMPYSPKQSASPAPRSRLPTRLRAASRRRERPHRCAGTRRPAHQPATPPGAAV